MEKNSEKITPGKIIFNVCLLLYCVAYIVLNHYITGEESVFYKASFGNAIVQDVIYKIPAVIRSIFIIIVAIFAHYVINFVNRKTFNKNPKMKTVMSLLFSVIKWVIIIVTILAILNAFGVDTATLVAGVGIITLVVGLGAQSLISDILAGFFLVFEGEYRVGDIISIDGWRGTVKNIGIRVTQLEDAGGNVKTINNSDVRNVVNQTNELSVAKVTMPIDYGESLERVEEVLKSNLDAIAKNIPAMKEGPFYKGVSGLADSSVNLLIIGKCYENDIFQVQRDLTRELYILFNKNHIGIPFNQIVLSSREDAEFKVSNK